MNTVEEAATGIKHELRNLAAEMLRPYIGKVFVFKRPADQQELSGGRVELELLTVTSHDRVMQIESARPEKQGARLRAPFSLLFVLKEGTPPLGWGLHLLQHEDFAAEEWHVARVHVVGRNPARAYYESVFG